MLARCNVPKAAITRVLNGLMAWRKNVNSLVRPTTLRMVISCAVWLTLSACIFQPPSATKPPSAPGFPPGLDYVPDAPLASIVDSGEETIFEEPDSIVAFHGFACAESNQSDRQNVL